MVEHKIRIKNLTKYYGPHKGIENLDLEVASGEIFGFLGPNGAGKTTTIRCLMSILLPTSGDMWINGDKISRKNTEIKNKIGYIPGELYLPEYFNVNDFLDYIESMRKSKSPKRKELVDMFQLPTDKKISELSKGNKQKVGLIAAFMHDPDVLILDEPTSGLDPLLQQKLYDLVLDAKKRGKTVFFSSHNLAEVQKICDRVGIIKDGSLVSVEDVDSLNRNVPRVLEVTLNNINQERLDSLGMKLLDIKDNKIRILITQGDSIKDFLNLIIPMEPIELSYPPASLQEYFMTFYDKKIKEE